MRLLNGVILKKNLERSSYNNNYQNVKMDKKDNEFWNKYEIPFNLNVDVSVRKTVCKDDIIMSLLDEGDVIIKLGKGHTKINLKSLKSKRTIKEIKLFKEILWKPIEDYLRKEV